jgi:hypothetical protein
VLYDDEKVYVIKEVLYDNEKVCTTEVLYDDEKVYMTKKCFTTMRRCI